MPAVRRICSRIADMLPPGPPPDARQAACTRCAEAIYWVPGSPVPAGALIILNICTRCVVADQDLRDDLDPGSLRLYERCHAWADQHRRGTP
jgi:hypothetical protein